MPTPESIQRCGDSDRTVSLLVEELFTEEQSTTEAVDRAAPLATRMRPRSLDEFVGQHHILAPGKLLRRAIEADRLPSVIFSGPPGTGKTTLARVIAEITHATFVPLSGVETNVAEMRRVLAGGGQRPRAPRPKNKVVLFEKQHFKKKHHEKLLSAVERGNP